jgi:hypothetical protein
MAFIRQVNNRRPHLGTNHYRTFVPLLVGDGALVATGLRTRHHRADASLTKSLLEGNDAWRPTNITL